MSKTYKIGVIGLGMGGNMLPVNKTDIPFEVVAICDVCEEPLKRFQAEHPEIVQVTTDYRDLCSNPDLDVIAVFSPDPLHFEHCKAALENGKHLHRGCRDPGEAGGRKEGQVPGRSDHAL